MLRLLWRFALSISICFVFVYTSHSQTGEGRAIISGSVTQHSTGESIRGITVAIYKDSLRKNTEGVRGTFTNKYGFYSIPKVEPGEYFLFASGVGYATYLRKISLSENEELHIDINLRQKDVRKQEIVVEDKREAGSPNNTSAIELSSVYVAKLPSLIGEVDLFRTIQLLPGVQQSSELSSGLYIRGGSPDQNLTLLDGVIVYNPSHLGGFLSTFNSDAIRDVKLIKGAFPAEYGGRLSSVIDISMKEGNKEKFSGAGGLSIISSKLTLEGPIGDNSSFMISGRRMYLDLVMKMMADDDEVPTYYFYDLNAKANIKLGENDRLFFSGYFGDDVLEGPPDVDDNLNVSWGNATANLRWMHIASSDLFTSFSFIYTHYQFSSGFFDKESQQNAFSSLSRIKDIMLRGEAQYFANEEHTIKAGLELIHHQFTARAASDFIEDNDFIKLPEDEIGTIEGAVYIQDEWKPSPLLSTNLGLRFFYFQEGNYFNIEPRLSASYNLGNDFFLKGAFAMVNQNIHLLVRNDINLPTDVWFPSTKNVETSSCWQGVLGLEKSFLDGEYYLSAEVYYKQMQNLYEYKDDAEFSFGIPLENQFTKGTGDAYGLELFLNKRIGDFTGWIGYTLAWTTRDFSELNNGKTFYPRYDRRHDIKLAMIYELGESWEFAATWVFGTGQAYTMPTGVYSFDPIGPDDYNPYNMNGPYSTSYEFTERNGFRLPPFHKLDLNFIYKFEWFNAPFALSFNIYNAYNRRNPFLWYIDTDYESGESKNVVKQVTLFPFLPSLGLSFKF